MKPILTVICALALTIPAVFAAEGPDIQIIDGKVSIHAEDVPLSRLLGLLDRATGMKSQVPPELADRNVSVRFSGLAFDAAVRKIFEGRSLDYMVIGGQGIVVTAVAQALPRTSGPVGAAEQSPFNQPGFMQDSFAQDNLQPMQVMPPQGTPGNPQFSIAVDPFVQEGQLPNGQQPAVIQTPFGPIPNPNVRAAQGPNGAMGGLGVPISPAAPNPNNNSLFGNTSPPAFNQNNTAPASGLPGLVPTPFPATQQPVRK